MSMTQQITQNNQKNNQKNHQQNVPQNASQKPNIIFFFSDQQRWDTLGCYGQKLNVTPHLDKMAEEGVKFEFAFTCQPVCGPARACLQTGKYATEIGCHRNGLALPQDEKTIAHWFNENGYETAYVGKWHLASNGEDFNFRTKAVPVERRGGYKDYWMAADVLEFTSHGYDGFVYDKDMNKVEFKGYRADCITDFALDYLKSKKSDKPFFLFLSHIEPHHQNDRNRYEGPNGSKEQFKDYEIPEDLVGTDGDWRENYPDYLGCCNSLDNNLGRIRQTLEHLGLSENTIIVYTSDHGSHFRTRNSEYKRSCHENCIRIPLIAYGPGFKGGKTITELVSLMDLPPTLLKAAGINKPESMKGQPLQQLLQISERQSGKLSEQQSGQYKDLSNATDWPQEVFLQISESHVGRAIRTKKWKYSVRGENKDGWLDSCSDIYVEDCLYDLEQDYSEKHNLIHDPAHSETRKQLCTILKKRMAEAGEQGFEILMFSAV